MALSERDKELIIEKLDLLDDEIKKIVLVSMEAFAKWLADVLYSIFIKVRNIMEQIWGWLSSIF